MYLQWLVHGRPDAIRPTEEAVQRASDVIEKFQRDATTSIAEDGNAQSSDKQGEALTEEEANDIEAWKAASTYVTSLGKVFEQRVNKLPGRDWYRLRRLLEVAYTIASKKAAVTHDNTSEEEMLQNLTEKEVYTGIRSGSLSDLGYDVRCFFLCPTDRMTHFHTVDERCEQMLLRGLLRETANLYVKGGLPEESQVTRAIGYRQTLQYLQRKDAKRNDTETFAKYIDDFATATRQYAKKQMQWFRRDGVFAFVPVDMECEKTKRVADAAKVVSDMCMSNSSDFRAELSTAADEKVENDPSQDTSERKLSLSAQTKLENEKQGKKMKFFMSKRVHLIDGTDDFKKALAEADECTRLVQGLGDGDF